MRLSHGFSRGRKRVVVGGGSSTVVQARSARGQKRATSGEMMTLGPHPDDGSISNAKHWANLNFKKFKKVMASVQIF